MNAHNHTELIRLRIGMRAQSALFLTQYFKRMEMLSEPIEFQQISLKFLDFCISNKFTRIFLEKFTQKFVKIGRKIS